jgi:hypothetical protein
VFNGCVRKATKGGFMKAIPKTRASDVTSFVLGGRWPLDDLDQPTMRWLCTIAKRKHVAVIDVIYEALDSFVAKWEADAELGEKLSSSGAAKRWWSDGWPIPVRRNQSTFLRVRDETPAVAAMCINNPDCSPVGIIHPDTQLRSNRLC